MVYKKLKETDVSIMVAKMFLLFILPFHKELDIHPQTKAPGRVLASSTAHHGTQGSLTHSHTWQQAGRTQRGLWNQWSHQMATNPARPLSLQLGRNLHDADGRGYAHKGQTVHKSSLPQGRFQHATAANTTQGHTTI